MTTAMTLATNLPTPTELGTIGQMAKAIYSSGLFSHNIKSEAAAVTIILTCRELGIPPVYGCNNVHVINGKPSLSAALMHALIVNRLGGNALRVTETTADRCTVEYRRPEWDAPGTLTWTFDQAQAAGLVGGKNDNWTRYRAEMLRSRCIAAAARLVGPDILAGMYTPEELGAAVTVTSEGEVTVADILNEAAGAPEWSEPIDLVHAETSAAPRSAVGSFQAGPVPVADAPVERKPTTITQQGSQPVATVATTSAAANAPIAPLQAANLAKAIAQNDPERQAAAATLRAALKAKSMTPTDAVTLASQAWPHIQSAEDFGTLSTFQLGRLTDVVTGESIIDAHGKIVPAPRRPEPVEGEQPTIVGELSAAMRS